MPRNYSIHIAVAVMIALVALLIIRLHRADGALPERGFVSDMLGTKGS
jgi:hypothetical protein